MDNQSQYPLSGNNELLINQNYESGQIFGENYPDGNISVVNGSSPVNIDQYNLADYSLLLNSNVTAPEFSTYNTNDIQLNPIAYDANSYLYNIQSTNYNNFPITDSINYTGTKKKPKEYILILPLYLSGYQYDTTNQSNYISQTTSYDKQPNSILVDYGYGGNNTSDIYNQCITAPTTSLITFVDQNQNNLNNLSFQNEYVTNNDNTQLQNVVETYPNGFYSQNLNVNMDPYYLTQSDNNNNNNNSIDIGTYNLTSDYNTYNLNQPIEETISQPYQNNLSSENNNNNSNSNNLGVIRTSNKHIDSAYLIKSMPISKNSHNRISLPPVVIIPTSKEEYTPIKEKRYIQKVKALYGKREKIIIPAYDNTYDISNNNNFIITDQNNNNIQNTQNIIISENNNNYIPSNENYASGNVDNYIQNTQNDLLSGQDNNYIQSTENVVIYGQENNNALNYEDNNIYGQENNFISNAENTYISGQESNYLSTNDSNNNSISKENNLYLQTPKTTKTTNTILPPRTSFIEKPTCFRTPIKKVCHKKYFSTGVRATSPLRYTGETSTNFVSLSPKKTPLMENGVEFGI